MKIELIKRLNSGKKDAKNILIIGVFHGDEPQGEFLIEKYLSDIDSKASQNPLRGKVSRESSGVPLNNVYYIPRLNSQKTRVNQNGVDLNRNFPTKNWGQDTSGAGECALDYYPGPFKGSEEETKFIVKLMDEIPFDAIITLHSPYKIINFDGDKDGEAERLSNIVSEITGYPVQKDIGYPTPGSFGTYAGVERDIPTITIEMDENIPVDVLYPKFKELFGFLEFQY